MAVQVKCPSCNYTVNSGMSNGIVHCHNCGQRIYLENGEIDTKKTVVPEEKK